jgi:hypothetical protein
MLDSVVDIKDIDPLCFLVMVTRTEGALRPMALGGWICNRGATMVLLSGFSSRRRPIHRRMRRSKGDHSQLRRL